MPHSLYLLTRNLAAAADWPQWGRDASRNSVCPEKNPTVDFAPPKFGDGKVVKPGRNIAWHADLGTAI